MNKYHLDPLYEKIVALQNIYIDRATGGDPSEVIFLQLRQELITQKNITKYLPQFVRTHHSIDSFWQFIKHKYDNYAERRQYIYSSFSEVLSFLEEGENRPIDGITFDNLAQNINEEGLHELWQKALDRRVGDPDGAITASRSLLETVCKYILDDLQIGYNEARDDLNKLYRKTASTLNLSPDQHSEEVFKQILGGCSSVVNGLSSMRNKFGDAHGQSVKSIKPAPRHAELAVNLSGAVSVFLLSTYKNRKE